MKNNKGITLIALVITIVVLIILTAITVIFTLGDNGIIERSKQAKEDYKQSEQDELIGLNSLDQQIASTSRGENVNNISNDWTLIAELTKSGEENAVDVDFKNIKKYIL